MNRLNIDEKWAVEYDPAGNDRPVNLLRYGEQFENCAHYDNAQVAIFYALLEARNRIATLEAQVAAADRLAEAALNWREYGMVLAKPKYHHDLDAALAAYHTTKEKTC